MPHLALVLKRLFGHDAFRPGQREILDAMFAARDVVAVMPTGAGKSLCFQLPAIEAAGTTIVVSPLIALMKDQVDALVARGIAAAAIHSGLDGAARAAAHRDLAAGRLKLAYVAPERLTSGAFLEALRRVPVARLVVDEAHCISQWGHDFRPDYRRIGPLRRELGVPAAAFTATATADVRADIATQLGMADPVVFVTGFERPNLHLGVETCRSAAEKERAVRALLRDPGPPGIVYCATRRHVDEWTARLTGLGLSAAAYHAGAGDAARVAAQDAFLSGKAQVIVATNAFGMGIDKPDIRFVVHADLPGSIEAYYQEAGRAGRDGLTSRCVLLFSPADIRTQEFFVSGANPAEDLVRAAWAALGSGPDDDIASALGDGDAARESAARTALRLLRLAAEARGIAPGSGALPINVAWLAEKARRDRARLAEMTRYAFARTCRSRAIFEYFAGSRRDDAPRCGTCDVCLATTAAAPLTAEEREQVRSALALVAVLDARFGAERLAHVLAGVVQPDTAMRGLDRQAGFGSLAVLGLARTRRLLDALVDGGLLRRVPIESRPGASVIAVGPNGAAVLRGAAEPQLAFPPAAAPAPARRGRKAAAAAGPVAGRSRSATAARARSVEPAGDGADPGAADRLESLRRWRAAEAKRRKVPAYVIFHDATLAELAARRPRRVDDLQGVKGMGAKKFDAFGAALFEILGPR